MFLPETEHVYVEMPWGFKQQIRKTQASKIKPSTLQAQAVSSSLLALVPDQQAQTVQPHTVRTRPLSIQWLTSDHCHICWWSSILEPKWIHLWIRTISSQAWSWAQRRGRCCWISRSWTALWWGERTNPHNSRRADQMIIDALGLNMDLSNAKHTPAERKPLVKDAEGEPA